MKRIFAAALMVVVVLLAAWPAEGQQWRYVATVISDASAGESSVVIDVVNPFQEGRRILIENREGTYREEHYVRHVYGRYIILGAKLEEEFLTGSKIYQ